MANHGEVRVELTLLIEKAQRQARAAASMLGMDIGKGATNVATVTDKATAAQDKLEKSTKKTTSALQKQREEWHKLNPGGIAIGQKITIAGDSKPSTKFAKWYHGQTVPMIGTGLATKPSIEPEQLPKVKIQKPDTINLPSSMEMAKRQWALIKPVLPNISFPKLPNKIPKIDQNTMPVNRTMAVRLINPTKPVLPNISFPALPKMQPKPKGIMETIKMFSDMLKPLGVLMATFYMLQRTVRFLIKPLVDFGKAIMQAAENAKRIFASAMNSGFGTSMTVKRNSLSTVLGVSEDQIFQFGAAIKFIGDRLDVSNKVLAETAPHLAVLAWSFSELGQSMKAVWAELTDAIAGPLNNFINGIQDFIDTLLETDVLKSIGSVIAIVIAAFSGAVQIVMVAINSLIVGFQLIADTITWLVHEINKGLSSIPGMEKLLGIKKENTDTSHDFDKSTAAAMGLRKQIANIAAGDTTRKAPSPTAFMKQMPTSSWERMGLNIGGGGGTNYQEKTAANTAKTATLVQKLLESQAARKFNITQNQGMPSTA